MNKLIQSLPPSLRSFAVIWIGQFVSGVGSSITEFAMGIWVYQQTGSVTQFALVFLIATLPSILISPIAGTFVDRWSRRWIIIIGDVGAALITLIIVVLLAMGRLEIWHIYVTTAFHAILGSFQGPAFDATFTLMVPKDQLGRVNGIDDLGDGIQELLGPLLGGILFVTIGLYGIVAIEFVTMLVAVTTLLMARIPELKDRKRAKKEPSTVWADVRSGLQYLRERPGLLGIMFFFATTNFLLGIVMVLVTPVVLTIASPDVLGYIYTAGAVGAVASALLMSIWGGPDKGRIKLALGLMVVIGFFVILCGLPPSIPLWLTAAFVIFFCDPTIDNLSFVVLQRKTDPEFHGRVFSIDDAVSSLFLPLGFIIAGPLADYVFEPLMAVDGAWAGSLGQLIGTGEGRGAAVIFMIVGLLTIVTAVAAYQFPRLVNVEEELPDLYDDDEEDEDDEDEGNREDVYMPAAVS